MVPQIGIVKSMDSDPGSRAVNVIHSGMDQSPLTRGVFEPFAALCSRSFLSEDSFFGLPAYAFAFLSPLEVVSFDRFCVDSPDCKGIL